MELNQLIEAEANRREEKLSYTYQCIKDCETDIIAGRDVERNLELLGYAYYKNQEAYEAAHDKKWVNNLRSDFNLFERMANTLTNELDAIVKDDKILFKRIGKSLSFNLKILASMFNLHSGMFGFDSTFTTHEAYTETGRLIHIGISREDENMIIINFNFLKNN